MDKLADQTCEIYSRNAAAFDQQRTRDLHEKGWLDRVLDGLPQGADILDLGCGTGDPIAAYITAAGHRVTGIDAAVPMIAIARARRPNGDWRVMDMRDLRLDQTYDAIIGWNSFFHLKRPEQKTLLPKLVGHLKPGGRLMLTVGYGDGEVTGHAGNALVYHASLAPDMYRDILGALGCTVLGFTLNDADCNMHNVLLAEKSP